MTFPEQFDHHGLLYMRSIEMMTDGGIILQYKCVNHPDVGPEISGPIISLSPDRRYVEDAMSAIHFQISEVVTQLAILGNLEDKKKGAKAPLIDAPNLVTSRFHLESE